jgi:putative two-component system response regulator
MANLLIVDDDDDVRNSLRRVLEHRGHHVQEAPGVEGARGKLALHNFDLVLCDIHMNGESGLELARQVAAELPGTGVIMITGVDDPKVAEEAMTIGAVGYLVKPLWPNEVLINVDLGLRRRELEISHRSHLDELEAKVLSRTTALHGALGELQRSEEGAQLAEREMIDRLVAALTLRSEETGGHIKRMSHYASVLATARGVDEWTEEEFRIGAMLHDVGKIGVPDAVLLKAGPLSEPEFRAIKRHPELGARLLGGGSRVLVLGARISLSHHERWDGAGYPGGLAGDAIPIEGRIAAVADVFDALTSDRVYREALAPEQALMMMFDGRARHFDPELLDLFEACMGEALAIRDAYADPVPVMDLRVVVIDGHRLFSDALSRRLNAHRGITVIGTAASWPEADALPSVREADVIVVDARLADPGDAARAGRILRRTPGSVVLLTSDDNGAPLLNAGDFNCTRVVSRDRALDELVDAIAVAKNR